MAITRRVLSGSSFGKPIDITGTASTAFTIIHQGGPNTSTWDEVYIWAHNRASMAITLLTYLGASTTANEIRTVIGGYSTEVIMPGTTLLGSTTASDDCEIKAIIGICQTSIALFGYANRIT